MIHAEQRGCPARCGGTVSNVSAMRVQVGDGDQDLHLRRNGRARTKWARTELYTEGVCFRLGEARVESHEGGYHSRCTRVAKWTVTQSRCIMTLDSIMLGQALDQVSLYNCALLRLSTVHSRPSAFETSNMLSLSSRRIHYDWGLHRGFRHYVCAWLGVSLIDYYLFPIGRFLELIYNHIISYYINDGEFI